ncbi:cytochrome P450 family protein [Thermomonospora cellulosilytica]|uniref:Cytochrome P450 n=1 Tax=Thermomonospora cellulosilytica TaxID=1411118 RepID=A0A7W3N595_9ACTN|nr:cytochrome P450 [Thermomonospora cellulosilytica]MBA9007767.1 cytochrome P450 [Thermomonospora cellulosilytica]
MHDRCPVLDPSGRDIHAEADRLRAQAPAVKVELPGGVHAWSVNSYEVIKQLLLDRNVTKNARNHWPKFINGEIPPDWEMISWVAMDNMVTAYGKHLVRLRRLISKAFTAHRTEMIRPRVEKLVDQLLDGLAAEPDEVVDLREKFCYPLPALLIADLIGMTEEQRVQTAKAMDLMVDTTVSPEQAQAILNGWRTAMDELIASKRRNPGEDIASDLIAARDDENGGQLTDTELTDTIFAILGAGSETTINFLDNAVTALVTHPDQLELVLSGQVGWDEVIDEVLRVQCPLASLPLRYAVTDIELDGVTIPQGDPILINYAAAGRDPALHGDSAGEFDITRENKEHISFGHGPHYCLGAGIARLVATIGLSRLFDRFPQLRLAVPEEELQPLPTFIMNGHRALPVRLTAAPADATAA